MAAEATLITHCGAQRVTRQDLAAFVPPPPTATWKPIKHSDLIDALHAELARRALLVRHEQYAVQHQGSMLFGTLELAWQETDMYTAALGLRTANDKSMALQLAVGLKIVVCDNLAFAGDLIALRRKHTAGLDLARDLARALDRYQERFPLLTAGVERLQHTPLADATAKAVIYDLFAQRIVPLRFFPLVVRAYHEVDVPRYGATLWALHNAVTAQIKALPPGPAFRATVRLGQLLGLQ
jgi:hypothetical protein